MCVCGGRGFETAILAIEYLYVRLAAGFRGLGLGFRGWAAVERRERLKKVQGLLPDNGPSQGQIMALAVLHVPNSVGSGIHLNRFKDFHLKIGSSQGRIMA